VGGAGDICVGGVGADVGTGVGDEGSGAETGTADGRGCTEGALRMTMNAPAPMTRNTTRATIAKITDRPLRWVGKPAACRSESFSRRSESF
jgi:hypothetical protein